MGIADDEKPTRQLVALACRLVTQHASNPPKQKIGVSLILRCRRQGRVALLFSPYLMTSSHLEFGDNNVKEHRRPEYPMSSSRTIGCYFNSPTLNRLVDRRIFHGQFDQNDSFLSPHRDLMISLFVLLTYQIELTRLTDSKSDRKIPIIIRENEGKQLVKSCLNAALMQSAVDNA